MVPESSGLKRKDPMVKNPVMLIVATFADPLCTMVITRLYTENGKKGRRACCGATLRDGDLHHHPTESL
jgi:hypothetical protein